jgi:hypothetical protein
MKPDEWAHAFAAIADQGGPVPAKVGVILAEAFPGRRERIATAALAGLLANPSERNGSPAWSAAYAKVAVESADALIKELDK